MGIVADRISQMRIQVTSPDSNLRAVLHGSGEISIELRPGSYRHYSESTLATQIADILDLVSEGFQSAMDSIVEIGSGLPPFRAQEEWNATRRRYLTERNQIEASGQSPDGSIELHLFELRFWDATISPGTLNEVSEDDFAREVRKAVSAVLQDFSRQDYLLKKEHRLLS